MATCTNILRAAFVAAAILALQSPAQAATGERRVPFDSVPDVVQGALTDSATGISNGASASVWQGLDRGETVYTGRVTDIDGSMRIVDVDPAGRVLRLMQFAPPAVRRVDPGQMVSWNSLSPGVQKTIGDNSRGARVTGIVLKTAANGVPMYVAATSDRLGLPVYIETTTDGSLIAIRRRPD